VSAYEHFCEQLELQQRLEEALERADEGRATADDIRLLSWAAGVRYQPKGAAHEMER
jgi:hypothetical protein